MGLPSREAEATVLDFRERDTDAPAATNGLLAQYS